MTSIKTNLKQEKYLSKIKRKLVKLRLTPLTLWYPLTPISNEVWFLGCFILGKHSVIYFYLNGQTIEMIEGEPTNDSQCLRIVKCPLHVHPRNEALTPPPKAEIVFDSPNLKH